MLNLKLEQPIGPAALDRAQTDLREHGLAAGLDAELLGDLILAFNELGTNVMDHSGSRWMEVSLAVDGDQVELVVRDDGVPFDPVDASSLMDAPFPYVQRHMGLFMLARLSFEKTYRRVDDHINELVLRRAKVGP